jgi:ATP-dependent Lhr-like helicase
MVTWRKRCDVLDLFHPSGRRLVDARAFAAADARRRTAGPGRPIAPRRLDAHPRARLGTARRITAFLWPINQIACFTSARSREFRPILYISPLKGARRRRRAQPARADRRDRPTAPTARGDAFQLPDVACAPATRRRRARALPARAADILITTPESLYLLLTSNAREALRRIDTVIVDEIHALVPTKRGAHLALSLERLQALTATPPQRIGLSATQRPLDEVARFLGGATARPADGSPGSRQTTTGTAWRRAGADPEDAIHDEFARTRAPRYPRRHDRRHLAEEAARADDRGPVEDMARIGETEDIPSGPAAQGPSLVDLVGDPSAAARAGAGAPLDADLRQQPAHRRTARGGAQRAARRARSCARTTVRCARPQRSRSKIAQGRP